MNTCFELLYVFLQCPRNCTWHMRQPHGLVAASALKRLCWGSPLVMRVVFCFFCDKAQPTAVIRPKGLKAQGPSAKAQGSSQQDSIHKIQKWYRSSGINFGVWSLDLAAICVWLLCNFELGANAGSPRPKGQGPRAKGQKAQGAQGPRPRAICTQHFFLIIQSI